MPKLYLVPHQITEKIKLYFNAHNSELAHEISRQLKSLPQIQIVESISDADIIIYFAGFDPPSLSQTLAHTSQLYTDLTSIRVHQTKFILVVKNPSSHLSRTAITLTSQYAHNYQLDHTVVEYDHSISVFDLASSIIKKFIYQHSPDPKPLSSPLPVSPQPVAKTNVESPKKFPRFKLRYLLFAVGVLVSPWIVSGLLSLVVISSSFCLSAPLCLRVATSSSSGLQVITRISPGFREFSARFGLPLPEVHESLLRSSRLSQAVKVVKSDSAQLFGSIFNSKKAPSATELLVKFSEVDNLLNLLQADLRAVYLATPVHFSVFEKIAREAGESRHALSAYLPKIQEFMPELVSGKKTIALLLQDNHEQRASGGLVESLILVKLVDGRVDNVQTFSIRNTDDQLVGTVAPPLDYQKTTHQNQWFLREVSWEPDTEGALQKAGWFIEKELNEKVDTVFLLNLTSLHQMLKVLGPVQIGESKKTITHSNFSAVYETQLESSQKYNQFMTTLFRAVFEKISTEDQPTHEKLLELLAKDVQSNQLLISTFQESSLQFPECRDFNTCHIDYFYPVSTNLTSSKTNLYLDRQHGVEITLTEAGQVTRHTFNYAYHPPQTTWLAPNHQEYLKLYLPKNATHQQLYLDGREISDQIQITGTQSDVNFIGTTFTVNKGQSIKIEFQYQTPLPADKQFHYQLDIPNQPGVVKDMVQLQLNYPPTWSALVDKVASVAAAGLLEYNYAQPNRFQLNIDFARP